MLSTVTARVISDTSETRAGGDGADAQSAENASIKILVLGAVLVCTSRPGNSMDGCLSLFMPSMHCFYACQCSTAWKVCGIHTNCFFRRSFLLGIPARG